MKTRKPLKLQLKGNTFKISSFNGTEMGFTYRCKPFRIAHFMNLDQAVSIHKWLGQAIVYLEHKQGKEYPS